MTLIAALPMYDLPELQIATDQLWAAIAKRLKSEGIKAPTQLLRGPALDSIWLNKNLLLAQTCGYPLVTSLAGKVAYLATPCYDAPGCDGPRYCSAIIVRAADPASTLAELRGRRCAINTPDSNSGMNLLRAAIAPIANGKPFFAETTLTGSHAASIAAIASNEADIAAIDCITWAHLQTHRPDLTRPLKILAWTQQTPGLPLITSTQTPAATRVALLAALTEITIAPDLAPTRTALRLTGFVQLPSNAYDIIKTLDQIP